MGALSAQYSVNGLVLDAETKEILPFGHICIDNSKACATSNYDAKFSFDGISKGIHEFEFSYIGFDSKNLEINLVSDTFLTVYLKSSTTEIHEVLILGKNNNKGIVHAIEEKQILESSDQNIGDIISKIEGVKVLKNGTSVAKPIIDGNYGTRINLINNGVIQSGQEWGNDHSPEIDAFSATEISTLNNAEALEYSANSLGGLVKIDQRNITIQKAAKMRFNYAFNLNGLGHTLNAQYEQYNKILPFRVVATYKRNGDYRSPDYYLTNTGAEEVAFSTYFEKKISKKVNVNLYYSLFHNTNGILAGAHVGNLSDLEEAIGREKPFFTENDFLYNINSPRQQVFHHLLKAETKILLSETQYLSFKYAFQLNNRKEFDVKRKSQSQTPSLSLLKITNDFGINHFKHFSKKADLKTGIQFHYADNTNNPETNILPLIPDYSQWRIGFFSVLSNHFKKVILQNGIRYDVSGYNVAAISNTLPRKIERHQLFFQNFSFASSLDYQVSKSFTFSSNLSYYSRVPEINELFSNGLHQGVSGIEKGDQNLKTEHALKALVQTKFDFKQKVGFSVRVYYQQIYNYIYLNPENEFVLTIRGAFPLFSYKQTTAGIFGTNLRAFYNPIKALSIQAQYSLVRGYNLAEKIPLIDIPPDDISLDLKYQFNDFKKFLAPSIGISGSYHFKQTHLLANQDYVPAPEAYFLLNLSYSNQIQLKKGNLDLSLGLENILNQKYRDYLNRLRYFADEKGINLKLRVMYNF